MSQIKLTADSGGGTTSLKAPSSTTSNADVVLKLPVADGSSGQVLKTDGSGQLSFGSDVSDLVNDTSPQLGGTLDTNGQDVNFIGDTSGRDVIFDASLNQMRANDNAKLCAGTSSDLEIYHSGSASYIDNYTGALYLRNNVSSDVNGDIYIQAKSGENSVICYDDGPVELYYDNTRVFETDSSSVKIRDDIKAKFGTGDDLQIYHDGSHTFMANTTGKLFLRSDTAIVLQDAGGNESFAEFNDNGAVELYYDGTKKFETASTGADFTVGTGEVDIYSTGSGSQFSLRLLNSDASAGNEVGILFGAANNVGGAYITSYSYSDFSSTANRDAGLRFGVRQNGTFKECVRINDGGFFQVSNVAGDYETHTFAADNGHQFNSNMQSNTTLWLRNTNANFSNGMLRLAADRAANTGYDFLVCTSGDLGDDEIILRGDGNCFQDGGTTFSTPADYAEYFEWTDGNSSDEDRTGMTVVLDGNKVKLSTSSDSTDNIIGVVSVNPAVVGDGAWNKWTDKYLKDDFNRYILDSDGHRKLNPSYDATKTYTSRAERKEWDAIGMVGKLRIHKGQKTGARWIKMRDISSSVEEWLVR